MKKVGLLLALCISLNFVAGCSAKETKEKQVSKQIAASNLSIKKLQASEYSFDTALSKGYVMRKTTSNDDAEKDEIYNKDSLDEFLDDIKKGKNKEVVIVEYLDQKGILNINKLFKIKYDGKKITADYYDTLTNKKEFKLEETATYKTVNVKETGDHIKYFFTDDTHDEIQLLSFNKSEINTNL